MVFKNFVYQIILNYVSKKHFIFFKKTNLFDKKFSPVHKNPLILLVMSNYLQKLLTDVLDV